MIGGPGPVYRSVWLIGSPESRGCCEHMRKEKFKMKIRKKILDYEYEEVLDTRTRELIRVGCAIAVGCPT